MIERYFETGKAKAVKEFETAVKGAGQTWGKEAAWRFGENAGSPVKF